MNERLRLKDWPARFARRVMSWRRLHFVWFLLLASMSITARAPAQHPSASGDLLGHKTVVLDPGHGGHDLGAVGPSGLAEKTVTLALANKIKDALAGDCAVYLTRDGDYRLDIEKRTAVANHHRADVFISIHAGSSFHHKARGMAIFVYGPGSGQGSPRQEMARDAKRGETLRPWGRIQLRHTTKSQRLADVVHDALVARLNPIDRGVYRAPCLVLRGADMPAILVEVGYISHPAEEKELKDPEFMSAVAEAVGQGVREFFRRTSGCMNNKGMIEGKYGAGRGAAW